MLKTQRLYRVEQERELEDTRRCIAKLGRQVVLSLFTPDSPPPEDGSEVMEVPPTQLKEDDSDMEQE